MNLTSDSIYTEPSAHKSWALHSLKATNSRNVHYRFNVILSPIVKH